MKVLSSLLSNAYKFTARGTVTASLEVANAVPCIACRTPASASRRSLSASSSRSSARWTDR